MAGGRVHGVELSDGRRVRVRRAVVADTSAQRLYERVRHLDRRMYIEDPQPAEANPVLSQFGRLQAAFGA